MNKRLDNSATGIFDTVAKHINTMKRVPLESLKLSRVEKIASDFKMISDELDVELSYKTSRTYPVVIIIRHRPNTINGFFMDKIRAICHRRGYYYNIHAFEVDGKIDLTVHIW